MGKFLEGEKVRQTDVKLKSTYLTAGAKIEGMYRKKMRTFCLPDQFRAENLFSEIRNDAIKYFAKSGIKWHDGKVGQPSNHLCDSQVCCVNFLYPFTKRPDSLKELLLPAFSTIQKMLPVENDQYVAFEWIGAENYLGEKRSSQGKRTRGANFTSADALVMFEHTDGRKQAVLIEWKYTESYSATSLAIAKSGTDRRATYRESYDMPDCPIDKSLVNYEDLFYEPFYQLFRQQLLAQAMERNKELGADVVSVLHIAPASNSDFKKITSQASMDQGSSPTGIWQNVVKHNRFISVSTEELFGALLVNKFTELDSWWNYITQRYSSVTVTRAATK